MIFFQFCLLTIFCWCHIHRQGLQNLVHNLEKSSKSLSLTVNIMLFSKGGHISVGEKWFHNGSEIEQVNSYKYLGIL